MIVLAVTILFLALVVGPLVEVRVARRLDRTTSRRVLSRHVAWLDGAAVPRFLWRRARRTSDPSLVRRLPAPPRGPQGDEASDRCPPAGRSVAECYSRLVSTMPTRIDRELFEAARAAGETSSRSAAQQLNHWASIGRALEASGSLSHREIQRVLAGDDSYDALAEREQAVVRAAWDERIAAGIAGLDLEAELEAAGESWSEADVDGRVVTRDASARG